MRRLVILFLTSLGLIGLGAAGGVAAASVKLHVLSQVCVGTKSRAVTAPTKGHCPAGSLLEVVGTTKVGKTGATGPAGPPGAVGAQGPQGLPGAPASTKTYILNWVSGKIANATPGVTEVGTATDDNTATTEATNWHFPVDVTACAIQVSVVSVGTTYSFYAGSASVGAGPAVQATRLGTNGVYVVSVWPGGAGVDFSLVVTCP